MSGLIPVQVGGTWRPGNLYIQRDADREFQKHVAEGRWVNICGCRTMGKSSLVVRWKSALIEGGFSIANVDLSGHVVPDEAKPPSATEFLRHIAEQIAFELRMEASRLLIAVPSSESSPVMTVVLRDLFDRISATFGQKVLVIFDELDVLMELTYGRTFLSALRTLHNDQAHAPTSKQIALCLVGWRSIPELVPSRHTAAVPFCQTIRMDDFQSDSNTIETLVNSLAVESSAAHEIVLRILQWTGGQPYFTMHFLDLFRTRGAKTVTDVDGIADEVLSKQESGPLDLFHQIQQFFLDLKSEAFAPLSTYMGLLEGRPESCHTDAPGVPPLCLSGLVRVRNRRLEIKSLLFQRHFGLDWARGTFSNAAGMTPRTAATFSADSRKRVCIINTGGTLGMIQRGDKVEEPRNKDEFLSYHPELSQLAEIEFVQMWALDSINVYPQEWVSLARFIYDHRQKEFAGFVVAHGTDTMAFTASAVAFALGRNLSFPVVFTGAQTTPNVFHGDARTNLYRAVLVAQTEIPEVLISFGKNVFRACCAQKRDDQDFDGFESPTYPPVAVIKSNVQVRKELIRPHPPKDSDIDLQASFATGILEIAQYPGLEPEFFSAMLEPVLAERLPKCNGIILQTLGAGNVPNRDPYSFLSVVGEAVRKGIPVLVTSQYPPDPESYKIYTPAKDPVDAGAIHAGNMTAAAAVAKFRWVLAQVQMRIEEGKLEPAGKMAEVRRMMQTSYVNEF